MREENRCVNLFYTIWYLDLYKTTKSLYSVSKVEKFEEEISENPLPKFSALHSDIVLSEANKLNLRNVNLEHDRFFLRVSYADWRRVLWLPAQTLGAWSTAFLSRTSLVIYICINSRHTNAVHGNALRAVLIASKELWSRQRLIEEKKKIFHHYEFISLINTPHNVKCLIITSLNNKLARMTDLTIGAISVVNDYWSAAMSSAGQSWLDLFDNGATIRFVSLHFCSADANFSRFLATVLRSR